MLALASGVSSGWARISTLGQHFWVRQRTPNQSQCQASWPHQTHCCCISRTVLTLDYCMICTKGSEDLDISFRAGLAGGAENCVQLSVALVPSSALVLSVLQSELPAGERSSSAQLMLYFHVLASHFHALSGLQSSVARCNYLMLDQDQIMAFSKSLLNQLFRSFWLQ